MTLRFYRALLAVGIVLTGTSVIVLAALYGAEYMLNSRQVATVTAPYASEVER